MAKVIFRELPGIADIEVLSQLVANGHPPTGGINELWRKVGCISRSLFGLEPHDTLYVALPSKYQPATEQAWEKNFAILELDPSQQEFFWVEHDIDVTDGKGNTLYCLVYFSRQMVCCLNKLHFSVKTGWLSKRSPKPTDLSLH